MDENAPKQQVDPSTMQPQDDVSEAVFLVRGAIKDIAHDVKALRDSCAKDQKSGNQYPGLAGADVGEMIANFTLAYRHLEDAAMRLGKVMQAKNGGVSVLSR